jgi:predicted nucleotidyltransferase
MGIEQLSYLTAKERQALTDFIARLKAVYVDQVRDVRLFGSKARGDFGAESDLDILIVVADDESQFRRAISRLGSEIDLEYGIVLSELTMSQARFDWHRRHRAPLYRNLVQESVSLWTSTPES